MVNDGETRCSRCGGAIKVEAGACRYCGHRRGEAEVEAAKALHKRHPRWEILGLLMLVFVASAAVGMCAPGPERNDGNEVGAAGGR